ncbi:hypothetical protein [uncultured Enterococcus sp.]|uniref:hypothetical protein n=1 Tax=uncultured Enterococcus sp. TaxID=167972 RepID=UPI002AA7F90A|nr:hypothetical protein [uncultured Enterococcus sp.]
MRMKMDLSVVGGVSLVLRNAANQLTISQTNVAENKNLYLLLEAKTQRGTYYEQSRFL